MDNTSNFKKNKLKGDFAELICKHHFELMGCDVQKVGIEELSPVFAKLKSTSYTISSLKKQMQMMPDFLVVHPSEKNASLVEVKYRNNSDENFLKDFSDKLHKRYNKFIKDGVPLYFYLVTNKKPYIFIMKAKAPSGRENTGGFFSVEDKKLNDFPFFKGYGTQNSFNDIYKEIILPVLENLIL